MSNSLPRFAAVMATIFFGSYLIAFLITRQSASRQAAGNVPVAGQTAAPEPAPAPAPEYALTADRVTLGSGNEPDAPAGPHAALDKTIRRLIALPDGPEKSKLAEEIAGIRDRAAAPVLLDWAVVTTDRTLLRSTLDALGPMGDGEMVADIRARFAAVYREDDRYRLGKITRNIKAPEAVPALIDLSEDSSAPPQLRVGATEALATIATPPAVSLLLSKVDDAAADDIGRLLSAISRIDSAQALSTLRYAAVGNKDASSDRARIAAIQALANFSDDETRRLLQNLDADSSVPVRDAARAVLARAR